MTTEESPPKVDNAIAFRRSPRLKSDSVDANNGNVGSSGKSVKRKGRLSVAELRLLSEGKDRRRSPRFSVASESEGRDSSSRSVK
ncbi:DNA (cytosine-5)-methyltransferase CMT2-like, partial [Trifolium medium]|nr:DNA (cytosine-5)-methyltransferase CMT2-like [Trifolium medium]